MAASSARNQREYQRKILSRAYEAWQELLTQGDRELIDEFVKEVNYDIELVGWGAIAGIRKRNARQKPADRDGS